MTLFAYNPAIGAVPETIDFAGDYDVYQVDLIGGVDYFATALGQSSAGGSLQDPYIEIYDSVSGELLYDVDDSTISGVDPVLGSMLNDALDYPIPQLGSTSLDPSFTFQAPYSGTYDVVVGGVNGSSGSYTFDLDQAGIPSSLIGDYPAP